MPRTECENAKWQDKHLERLSETDFPTLPRSGVYHCMDDITHSIGMGYKTQSNLLFELLSRSLSLHRRDNLSARSLSHLIEDIQHFIRHNKTYGRVKIKELSDCLHTLSLIRGNEVLSCQVLPLINTLANKDLFPKGSNGEICKFAPTILKDLLTSINAKYCRDEEKAIIFNAIDAFYRQGFSYQINARYTNPFKVINAIEPVEEVVQQAHEADGKVGETLVEEVSTAAPSLLSQVTEEAIMPPSLEAVIPPPIQTMGLAPATAPRILTPQQQQKARLRTMGGFLTEGDLNGLKDFYEELGFVVSESPTASSSSKRKFDAISVASSRAAFFPVVRGENTTIRVYELVMDFFKELNSSAGKRERFKHYLQSADATAIIMLLLPFRCRAGHAKHSFYELMLAGNFDPVLSFIPTEHLSDCVDRIISPGAVYIHSNALIHVLEVLTDRMQGALSEDKEIILLIIQNLLDKGIEHHDGCGHKHVMVKLLEQQAKINAGITEAYDGDGELTL